MCCTRLAENTGRKNSPSAHHRTNLSGYIVTTKDILTIGKKVVKQQYLLHMFSQYGELRPTNGWERLASMGHPSKFQGVSRLGFVIFAIWSTTFNTGRHVHSAGWPPRSASAYILVLFFVLNMEPAVYNVSSLS